MNMTQLSFILGLRLGLLISSIGLFIWGGLAGGVIGTILFTAAGLPGLRVLCVCPLQNACRDPKSS